MNDASAAEQQQIFDAPLEVAQADAINALVGKHKSKAAYTQQLALDASRLVATSQERLARQVDAGFFKRLVRAVSGETTQNQLSNQQDMLQMQKCAWHVLQQLQQQNLLNAQSIAVIRNNLGTMNEYIIETRDFLEQVVDRFDQRLRHVENNTSFNNWLQNVEANKRRFKSTPRTLLILRLTYDFMRQHQHVMLNGNDMNYLLNALGKLDVDCDEQVELLDFISEMIDQIELVGIDQYRTMITLGFDEYTLDSDFIQKNISGVGFNALYFLSDHYEQIADLIGDETLCNSDEAREKIISKFFGDAFSGLSTTYAVRDLMAEMIAGGQIAIDLYKEENGLNEVSDEASEIGSEGLPEESVALLPSLPDIQAHTFLDTVGDSQAGWRYVSLLALVLENSASLSGLALEFVDQLAERASHPALHDELLRLADDPRRLADNLAVIQALLDDDDKKYTWLLDAFFLLALSGKPVENARVKALLGVLKPAELKERLPEMLTVVNDTDDTKMLRTVLSLANITQGWKNIIRYRAFRFDQAYAETYKRLHSVDRVSLNVELLDIYSKGMEHGVYINFSGDGFFAGLADKAGALMCSQARSSVISRLNDARRKAIDAVSEGRGALHRANADISTWGLPTFNFDESIPNSDFVLDNSATNEEWCDHFEHHYRQVENTLRTLSHVCGEAARQIDLFRQGLFDQSVVLQSEQRRREQEEEERQYREKQKREKQFVTVTKDDREHAFSIEWETLSRPPCKLDDIQHIKTDGKVWLIVATIDSNHVFYRSTDSVTWQQVQVDIPTFDVWFDKISIVNGVWIIKNRALREGTRQEGIYYSHDALAWTHVVNPEKERMFGNITFFAGQWLWITTKYERYSYIEKGFFSDSEKSGSYVKTTLYRAQALDGPWQAWEGSPRFDEGVEIQSMHALPDGSALLAFCEYGYSYLTDKKKPKVPPFVMYYGARKEWRKVDWSSRSTSFFRTPLFVQAGDGITCFFDGEVLASEKGYDWTSGSATVQAEECISVDGLHLLISGQSSGVRCHISADDREFKEVIFGDGEWRHVTISQGRVVAVNTPHRHEETVLRVGCCVLRPVA